MQFCHRSLAIGWNLAVLAMTFTGCPPVNSVSRIKSLSNNIFVALSDPKSEAESPTVQVSLPKSMEASICVTGNGAACDGTSEKYPLRQIDKVGDRLIYSPQSAPQLAALKDYLVMDVAGRELLRFRLKQKGPGGSLEHGLSQFVVEQFKRELAFISQDKFQGRLSATKGNEDVADFLIGELKKMNVRPLFGDNYRQTFTMPMGPTQGKRTSNIMGLIEGSDPVLKDEYVVLGAHMDHTGTLDLGYTCNGSFPGVICNGADDNGSGTIAVLNVAKALAASREQLKRSVIIMFFSGEEEGLVGSVHYVRNPAVPLKKHVFMINMDMVGYAKSFGQSIAAIGTVTSKWGEKTVRDLAKKYTSHKIRFTEKVEGGSDHAPFMNRGIPGVFYHTGVSNNPHYHRTTDHPELIDYDGMLVAAKLAYETVVAAGSAPELTPASGMNLAAEPVKFVSDTAAAQGCHALMDYQYVD